MLKDADLAKDFSEDTRNANKGTERGKRMLDRSIAELGAGRSILVDKNGVVIAGNKTRQAMVEAGIIKAKVVETDGKELVVVKRTDLDLSEEKGAARKLAYADNAVAQADLDWDLAIINEDNANGWLNEFFGEIGDVDFNLDDLAREEKEEEDKMVLKFGDRHLTVEEALLRLGKTKEEAVLRLLGMTEAQ